ncbi:MAG: DNA primase DnaG [Candidatus Heimdallarchaeota archaeon]
MTNNANVTDVSTTKYLIHSKFEVTGVVERSDVIGAVFGQTEGLLGEELDLRDMQRTGRIGRIIVNTTTQSGKTTGTVIIPSSLDRIETAIIAAALETVDRVGPCGAKLTLDKIEDVRQSKRKKIIQRATNILRKWEGDISPESSQLVDEVLKSARIESIVRYKGKVPAGPTVDESDSILIVEGRADVINLLRHGYKNVVAVEGTNIPSVITELSKKKEATAFLDGDRGGDLILRELAQVADIDYVARASSGREVEDLTRKEITKALRNRVPIEQLLGESQKAGKQKVEPIPPGKTPEKPEEMKEKSRSETMLREPKIPTVFEPQIEIVQGTQKGFFLDENGGLIKEVPVRKLAEELNKIKENKTIYAIIFDGIVTQRLVDLALEHNITYLVGARVGEVAKLPINLKVLAYPKG